MIRNSYVCLLFVKAPEKGMVKCRLAEAIGEEITLKLYKSFVLDIVRRLNDTLLRIYFYPPDSSKEFINWIGEGLEYMPQRGDDLGERMKNGFLQSFSDGFRKVLVIGSDLPDLKNSIIQEAFISLGINDTVIGPSFDGGYYLIGFRDDTFLPNIFHGISWGTESVFRETMKVFNESQYSVHVLPPWRDVDTLDDLQSLFFRNEHTDFRESLTMSFLLNNKHKIFCR
jgi:rSAM/selenodomain-associated transferase 1